MNKIAFETLFNAAIEAALQHAEQQLGRSVPRDITVQLHGAGHSGEELKPTIVLDELYLGGDLFYKIIDVAVIAVRRYQTLIFVRVSSHAPGLFDQTWNTPPGSGPFKQLIAETIQLQD